MKQFEVPIIYRSPLITAIKKKRKEMDKMKRNFAPTLLDLGSLHIYLARHFGFCYGVENAIEIAFRTIEENPGKRIFLLSEMIHNPQVNADLQAHGVKFLQDTHGATLIPFDELKAEDIVLIPPLEQLWKLRTNCIISEFKLKSITLPAPLSKKSGIVLKRSQRIDTPSSFMANQNMKKQELLFHMLPFILLQ